MSDYVEKWLRIAAEEIRADGHAGWGNTCEDGANHIAGLERYIAEIERGKVEALGMAAELEAENARLRETNAATAHRACCGSEHDAQQGKLHGYCVVCGVPWPCDTAKYFLFGSKALLGVGDE